MSKMDAPSMQDVYILSPVSGLYSTRSVCAAVTLIMWLALTEMLTAVLPPGRSWASCPVTTSAATASAPSPAPKAQRPSATTWTRTADSSSPCWRETGPQARTTTGAAIRGSAGGIRPPPMVRGRAALDGVSGAAFVSWSSMASPVSPHPLLTPPPHVFITGFMAPLLCLYLTCLKKTTDHMPRGPIQTRRVQLPVCPQHPCHP